MSTTALIQFSVFAGLTALVGFVTWLHCRKAVRGTQDTREYFLANGGLGWVFIAGSLTLTNINTDTLVGWNGNQMLLVVWWELAGIAGLILLAKVFLPLYYRYGCTTVTELLERRYDGNPHLRATVAVLFLVGNVFIFLPVMLYTSSLFLIGLFGLELPLLAVAAATAVAGAAYAIFGGLRAVAVSDTYSGVLLFGMALLVVTLGLSFTGYLLPWDQLAYWAITIGANIAQSPREVTDAVGITAWFDPGGLQRLLLLGSDSVGEEALIRFYLLHVMILPLAAAMLMSVHFWRVRKDGGLAKPADVDRRVDARCG